MLLKIIEKSLSKEFAHQLKTLSGTTHLSTFVIILLHLFQREAVIFGYFSETLINDMHTREGDEGRSVNLCRGSLHNG